MLDFGWSLSEVLKKSRESKQKPNSKELYNKNEDDLKKEQETEEPQIEKPAKSALELVIEGEEQLKNADDFIEIGTWSNDMADDIAEFTDGDEDEEDENYLPVLPANVKFCKYSRTVLIKIERS